MEENTNRQIAPPASSSAEPKPHSTNHSPLYMTVFFLAAFVSFLGGYSCSNYYAEQEYEKQWLGGYGTGYDEGYSVGKDDGYADGYETGYDDGELEGFNSGYSIGKDEGDSHGYDNGYDDGYNEGYSQGYLDGLLVGAASSPANSPSSSYSGSTSSGSYSSGNSTQSYTVYITDTGSKYHRSGCSYLKKSSHAISLSAAKAQGYTPCSRCNPPA